MTILNYRTLFAVAWLGCAGVAFAQEIPSTEGEDLAPAAPGQGETVDPDAAHPVEAQVPLSAEAPAAPPAEGEVVDPSQHPEGEAAAPPPDGSHAKAVEEMLFYNTVRLQGLNKVTARVSQIEATIGSAVRFGNLEIIARNCWQAPPEEQPENAALLEIWEMTPGEPPQQLFLGWMFSSSPGLSALEHPVYDITVLTCHKMQMPLE